MRLTLAVAACLTLAVSLSCGVLEDEPTATPSPSPTATPTTVPTPFAGPPVENLPMYLGSLGRTSAYDTEPAVKGEVKWKFEAFEEMTSSPVIDDGVVYFGSGRNLIAVDAAAGEELWRFETDDAVKSSPAVNDGVVFIGSDDSHLYALGAKTGQEVWKFKTGDRVRSSPVVSDGVVLVGSLDGHMYALDAATGDERWRFQTGEPLPCTFFGCPPNVAAIWERIIRGIHASAAVSDGIIVFGASDGNYYGLDLETGQKQWAFKSGIVAFFMNPAIADGVVYAVQGDIMTTHDLLGLDVNTGEEILRFDLGSNLEVRGVAVSKGVAYVGLENQELILQVAAIEVQTSRELWRQKIKKVDTIYDSNSLIFSAPAVAGNVVYVGNTRFNLHALFSGTGDTIWEIGTGQVLSSPTVADGVVYFTSKDGFLYAVE